ncbi:MAG TPA: hypothetical protein VKF62_03610 [Planctomycetota bacterium]|nr:hypothetical protein [Planctomycetota bacterium]
MTGGRLAAVVRAIHRRFPGTRVLLEPYRSPDGDPHIRWWLHVINVPARWRSRVDDFAILKGFELFGPGRLPYFSSVCGPRETAATIARWQGKMAEYRAWRRSRVASGRRRRLREGTLRARRLARGGRRDSNRRG